MREEINAGAIIGLSQAGLGGAYMLAEHYMIFKVDSGIDKWLVEHNYNNDGQILSYGGNDEIKIVYINRK